MPAKSLELKHTIKLIQELTSEINELEDAIRKIMDELKPPILSITGMGFHSAAMILAEVGDFSNFNSPDTVSYTHLDVYKRQVYDRNFNPVCG